MRLRRHPQEARKPSGARRSALAAIATFAVLMGASNAYAQSTFYVRAGATGAQNGSDWTNAFTRLPASMVRGATYYVADGTYDGSIAFNTPASGTTYIFIKKATESAHGT